MLDKLLLICAALLVCVLGGAAFWASEAYHFNPAWVFFAWNSVFLIPIAGWGLRNQWKNGRFISYFGAWMALHGFVVLLLMGFVPMLYWLPTIFVEMFVGYLIAYTLFGLPPKSEK